MATLLIYFVLSVILKDIAVSALTVTVSDEVHGVNGGNATFRISYILGSGETFSKFTLKKGVANVFEAPYYVPPAAPINDGKFLLDFESRGSTDYTFGKTEFTITLLQVTPTDQGQYSAEVTIIGGSKSSLSQLVVDFYPTVPVVSALPTEVAAGNSVNLTCSANLGKPQSSMMWYKYKQSSYTKVGPGDVNYTNSTNGTVSGVSQLKVTLAGDDNGVKFKCEVAHRSGEKKIAETTAITVKVPVSEEAIQICSTYKSNSESCDPRSFLDVYFTEDFTLTCELKSSSQVRPAPQFEWHKSVNGSFDKVTSTGAQLTDKLAADVATANYSCTAKNMIGGESYTAMKQIVVRATVKTTTGPETDTTAGKTSTTKTISDNTTDGKQPDGANVGAIVGGIVGGIAALIIIIVVLYCCVCKKKPNTSRDDEKHAEGGLKNTGMDSPDEGYNTHNTQPDVVAPDQLYAAVNKPKKNTPGEPQDPRSKNVEGLVYADLALNDQPRSRKPIQAYELTGTEYAEIMRK